MSRQPRIRLIKWFLVVTTSYDVSHIFIIISLSHGMIQNIISSMFLEFLSSPSIQRLLHFFTDDSFYQSKIFQKFFLSFRQVILYQFRNLRNEHNILLTDILIGFDTIDQSRFGIKQLCVVIFILVNSIFNTWYIEMIIICDNDFSL